MRDLNEEKYEFLSHGAAGRMTTDVVCSRLRFDRNSTPLLALLSASVGQSRFSATTGVLEVLCRSIGDRLAVNLTETAGRVVDPFWDEGRAIGQAT